MNKPCQHQQTTPQFEAIDYLSGESFTVVRCDKCGLTMTQLQNQIVAPINEETYYPNDYYGDKARYQSLVDKLLTFLIKRRTASLGALAQQKTGRVLDIGCGQGWFLDYFATRDWDCLGIEANQTAAYHAQQVLGLPVQLGVEQLTNLPDQHFDVIALWHVLEHLEQPHMVLAQAQRLLKPTGKLLLSVPNFSSWEAQFTKQHWFHLDVPRHIIHFTEPQLLKHTSKAQLCIEKKHYIVPEYDMYSFIQSMQNKLGLPMNLLYGLLRGGSFRGDLQNTVLSKSKRISQIILSLISAPILGLIALVWLPLTYLCGQGSSIVLVLGPNKKTNKDKPKAKAERVIKKGDDHAQQ